MPLTKKPIGDILVDNGQITPEELALATRESKHTGEPMSLVLARLGLAYEHHLKNALELQYGVTYVSLKRAQAEYEVLSAVPEAVMRKNLLVPLLKKGNRVTVVMVDPNYSEGLDAVKKYFPDLQLTPAVCTEDEFELFMSGALKEILSPPKRDEKQADEEKSGENKPEKRKADQTFDNIDSAQKEAPTAANTQIGGSGVNRFAAELGEVSIETTDSGGENPPELKKSDSGSLDGNLLERVEQAKKDEAEQTGDKYDRVPDSKAESGAAEEVIAESEPEPARKSAAAAVPEPEPARESAAAAVSEPEPARESAAAAVSEPEPAVQASQKSSRTTPVSEEDLASDSEYKTLTKGTASDAFPECEPEPSEQTIPAMSDDKRPVEALAKEAEDAAVVMLCNQILANAIAKGAATVHIHAFDRQVLVHYRLGGQLMVVRKLPRILFAALSGRFRKMGRVEQQDDRLPQDGRIKVRMSGKDFNLRLTIVPVDNTDHISVWIE